MDQQFLREIAERLQAERRAVVRAVSENSAQFEEYATTVESEIEEHAQEERDARILERLDERQQSRVRDIDAALARIDAGSYGRCANCGHAIDEARLDANPTTTLCLDCSAGAEAGPQDNALDTDDELPARAILPPDLDGLDDRELADHLIALLREDGQIDMEELQLSARRGVIMLAGALPSEGEHQQLLNILTDVAGIHDIVDRLEVAPLAWERDDRSKNESAQDVTPGTIPDDEPGSTEDIVLSTEEGVNYEPPINPPQPPYKNP